jgi:CRP-like cAMP-binding protein
MLGQNLLQTSSRQRSTPAACGALATRTPRQNRLLAALPAEDFARLQADLEPVPLPRGWTVHGADQPEQHLYFPTAGIVSHFYVIENGAAAEVAITGNEGVIGIASFMGGRSTPSQALVLTEGFAYRLSAARLKSQFAHGAALLPLLLRYTLALITQAGQTAVCNRYHSVQQQLCLWILTCVDRLPSDELSMTQEQIANMLGVRREGVSEAAGRLQKAGAIRCQRGRITLLDRARLEAEVCECYAVVKREFDRLLPQENSVHTTAAWAGRPQ